MRMLDGLSSLPIRSSRSEVVLQIVAAAADISQAWGMGAGVVKGASLRVLVSLCFAGDLEQGLGRWSVVCCEVDIVLSTTAAERGQFARKQGGRAMCARCT